MKYRLILLLIFLYGNTLVAQRVSSSDIVCLNIVDNNNVEIKWTRSDIDSFQSYVLYFSNDGSSFSPVSPIIIDVNDTTFLHTGIDAFNTPKYYYVKVNESDISPIAKTLFLQGIDVNPNGYQGSLFWTSFADTLDSGMSYYRVYYDYPDGDWHLLDTTAETSLRNFTLFTCDDSIRFKVEISYMNSCTSNSPVIKGRFTDIVAPDKPVLDSVSITADGNTVIGWTQSDSLDVVGNIIYRYDGLIWSPIDSVWGYQTQTYTDMIINPCNENYLYAISSFDSCGNNSPFTDLTAQRPLFLYDINYSVCDLKDTIRWTEYVNPKVPIERYEIWYSKNGGAYQLAGQKEPSDAVNGEITFIHQNLEPGADYEYFVRAIMGDISSSSCRKHVITQSYKIPQFVETLTADVLADNTVNVTVEGDMDVNNCIWNIWHFDGNQPDTTLVEQVTKPNQNSSPFFVGDASVDASINPWFYYTTVIDSCGKERLTSNTFKTIWLQGYAQDNINYLNWTAPEGWSSGVEKYYIYRTITGVEPTAPIDSVNGDVLQYQEPASNQPVEDGRIIYFVQALKKADTGQQVTSTSNRFPLFKEATLYYPNAFRPDGQNNEFKPVFSFFGGTNFLLQIYSRWGKLIFESSDPQKGWDGTIQNQPAGVGTYVYVSSYRSVSGNTVTQKGTVTLIR